MTYVVKKPPGYSRCIVVRTEESRQRAARRAVLRAPTRPLYVDPTDVAREKFLSRSKQYPNKGRNETARRAKRIARVAA